MRKMCSSEVAFAKFLSWKNRNMLLKAICYPRDKDSSLETHLTASVFSVLASDCMVGISIETGLHSAVPLDLRGAKFFLARDSKALDVVLADAERWFFSEESPS